jgi:hypothetical protein
MKKVVLPQELNEEFPNIKFIPYGDLIVRIKYDSKACDLEPINEIHKAGARLMEYNYPNLILPAFPWMYTPRHYGYGAECTLVFIDPDLFKYNPQSVSHKAPSRGPMG